MPQWYEARAFITEQARQPIYFIREFNCIRYPLLCYYLPLCAQQGQFPGSTMPLLADGAQFGMESGMQVYCVRYLQLVTLPLEIANSICRLK